MGSSFSAHAQISQAQMVSAPVQLREKPTYSQPIDSQGYGTLEGMMSDYVVHAQPIKSGGVLML